MNIVKTLAVGATALWLSAATLPAADKGMMHCFAFTSVKEATPAQWDAFVQATDRMPKKIRTHTKTKVPYLLIAGEEDAAKGAVSFRFRDGRQDNGVPVEEAVDRIVEAIRTRAQV